MSRKGKVQLSNAEMIAGVVETIRAERFPDFSRDQLLCHPEESIQVCREARLRLADSLQLGKRGNPPPSNFEILWTFLNQSKRSKLAIGAADKRRKRAAS